MAGPALLRFRRFERADLAVYASWFADEELTRRIPAPDEDWAAYVTDPDGGAVAEVAMLGAEAAPCALIQYDIDGDGGISLLMAVEPRLRRQGLGRLALEAFIARAAERFDRIDGWIGADNEAALALARRCRFRPTGTVDDGHAEFTRRLRD